MANDLIRISTDVFEMGLHLRQLINIKFIQTFAITIEFYEFELYPCSLFRPLPPAKYFICFGACFKFYYPRNSTLRRFVHVLILYGYSNQDDDKARAVSPYSSSLPSITSIHLDGRSFTWPL